ncbi:hypothetical protein EV278_13118 [Caulobacter sp. BK020]|nr:hypothetical protein EV278_13118 [Caulobacter sp. BK020]
MIDEDQRTRILAAGLSTLASITDALIIVPTAP